MKFFWSGSFLNSDCAGYSPEHAAWYRKIACSMVIKAFINPQSKLYRADVAKLLVTEDEPAPEEGQSKNTKNQKKGKGGGKKGGGKKGKGGGKKGGGKKGKGGGNDDGEDGEDDEENDDEEGGDMSEEENSE